MRAVIAVAGFGSRFFPIGKTINKCMLPILGRPVVDHAVADCVAAGVTEIALVVGPGETGRQVRHYFTEDRELKDFFERRGWAAKYAPLAGLHEQAAFTFIEQPRDDRYGTAVPVRLAADFIGDDDFLLVTGDDLLLRADGGSDLADLVGARTTAGTPAAIAAATVPGAEAHRYGILHPRRTPAGPVFDRLLEKPGAYAEPTAFINISRILLPAAVLPYFQGLAPAANGELRATDAVFAFARDHDMLIHAVTGEYHDCGNPAGWLAANNAAAADRTG
jgi:UTP--glucose-1-phosphate uridylyltransferase